MFFWNKFCGSAFFIVCASAALHAQNADVSRSSKNRFILKNTLLGSKIDESLNREKHYVISIAQYSEKKSYIASSIIQPGQLKIFQFVLPESKMEYAQEIPANFSTCQYGFFCKQELRIEKATKLPIRIRLGSLQQCNYYEGKP